MRSCEEMELYINLYLDGMLPSEETRQLEEHLERCQDCRERFEQLRAIKDALETLEEPAPEGLHGRILDYVEKYGPGSAHTVSPQPKVLKLKRWLKTLSTIAACALIAVMAVHFIPDPPMTAAEDASSVATDAALASEPLESDKHLQFSASAVPAVPEAPPAPAVPADPSMKNEMLYSAQVPESGQETDDDVPTDTTSGQLSVDLPPLRQENHADTEQTTTILKWMRADGPRAALPEWVDSELIYQTELDGQEISYVKIAVWAESYWYDQLTACGFTISALEGTDLDPAGESILLFFFWSE